MVSPPLSCYLNDFPIAYLRNVNENLSLFGNGTMESARPNYNGLAKYQVI